MKDFKLTTIDKKLYMLNKLLHIDAIVDQPGLLENLVEKLASRRYDIGYCSEAVPGEWVPVEVSSAETFVSGNLSFSASTENDEPINMPFITPMLFTCTKEKDDSYRLLWSCSLS
jgi:hypothetical protein